MSSVDEVDAALLSDLNTVPSSVIEAWVRELTIPGESGPSLFPSGSQILTSTVDDLCDAPFEFSAVIASELLLRCYMIFHRLAESRRGSLPGGLLSWGSGELREWVATLGPKQAPAAAPDSDLYRSWTGACMAAATNVMVHRAVKRAGVRYSLADASVLLDKARQLMVTQVADGRAPAWTAAWTGRISLAELPSPDTPRTAVVVPVPHRPSLPSTLLGEDAGPDINIHIPQETPPPPPVRIPTAFMRQEDEFSTIWQQHRALERRLLEAAQHEVSLEERQCISTDYPDVLDLTKLAHVLVLIGQFARFGNGDMLRLQQDAARFADAVSIARTAGDQLHAIRKARKDELTFNARLKVEEAQRCLGALSDACIEVEAQAADLRSLIQEMREEKGGFRTVDSGPSSQGEFGGSKLPEESARWFTRAVHAFKATEHGPLKHTVRDFVDWLIEEDSAQSCDAASLLVQRSGARRGAMVDKALLLYNVNSYMRAFHSSLPPQSRLKVISSTKR